MTEADWLTGTDLEMLLPHLRGRTSARKLRLFTCACCRHVWSVLTDERSRNAVETGERFADGLVDEEELSLARLAAKDALRRSGETLNIQAARAALRAAIHPAESVGDNLIWYSARVAARAARASGAGAQVVLLHDIFGNPFRPASFEPSWQREEVCRLARSIYQERRFDRLPLLAEALTGAGCVNEEILRHCRSPTEHAPGCWVVDGVLGQK